MKKAYQSHLSRRDSLKWLGALSASAMLPSLSGCEPSKFTSESISSAIEGHWPELKLPVINAKGYGKDPNLIIPPKSPWPLTLTTKQLTLVAVVADILVPRDGDVPSASEVHVPAVIDEWVSSPYQSTQRDRLTILSLLAWLDEEAKQRFARKFVELSDTQQLQIIDDIAFNTEHEAFIRPASAFSRFRKLVLAAFFCSPEGTKDLGYQGNVPIAGDYPGPTEEAMAHLNQILGELKLSL